MPIKRGNDPPRSEAWLRRWLRQGWAEIAGGNGALLWVEPARGGTVGAPDVFVPLGKLGWVPLELKASAKSIDDYVFEARPAQLWVHRHQAKLGNRMAFLVALPKQIIVFPSTFDLQMRERPEGIDVVESVEELRKLLINNGFWYVNEVRREWHAHW